MVVANGSPRKNKNKQTVCNQCCHVLSSDNLKRHLRTHQTPQYDVKAKKQKKVDIISREIAIDDDSFEKIDGILPVETIVQQVLGNTTNKVVINLENNQNFYRDIEKEVIRESEIFDENIELGEKISSIISSGRAKEESLSRKNTYCFKSHLREKWYGSLDGLVTRERLGSNPTSSRARDTNVLCVHGYSQDILHVLGKRSFYSTDIFYSIFREVHSNWIAVILLSSRSKTEWEYHRNMTAEDYTLRHQML